MVCVRVKRRVYYDVISRIGILRVFDLHTRDKMIHFKDCLIRFCTIEHFSNFVRDLFYEKTWGSYILHLNKA